MSLPSPLTLLSQAWKFYRSHAFTLLKLIILPPFFAFVLVALAAIIVVVANTVPIASLSSLRWFIIIPLLAISLISMIILSLLSHTAFVYFLTKPDNYTGLIPLFKSVWPLIGKFLFTQILAGLIILLGYILLIIPGVIFTIRYLFAFFVVVNEGKSGKSALNQSSTYAKGKFWAILGRFLFISIPAMALSLLITQINQLVVSGLIQLIITLVIAPIATIYLYQLYQSVSRTTTATS